MTSVKLRLYIKQRTSSSNVFPLTQIVGKSPLPSLWKVWFIIIVLFIIIIFYVHSIFVAVRVHCPSSKTKVTFHCLAHERENVLTPCLPCLVCRWICTFHPQVCIEVQTGWRGVRDIGLGACLGLRQVGRGLPSQSLLIGEHWKYEKQIQNIYFILNLRKRKYVIFDTVDIKVKLHFKRTNLVYLSWNGLVCGVRRKFFAHGDGGPRSWVYARETLCSAPYRHERKFSGTHDGKVTFKHLPQTPQKSYPKFQKPRTGWVGGWRNWN